MFDWLKQLLTGKQKAKPVQTKQGTFADPHVLATPTRPQKQPVSSPSTPDREDHTASVSKSVTIATPTQPQANSPTQSIISEAQWVPPGQTIEVAGYTLPLGMLYVGDDLGGISNHVGIEPCLIRPQLKIDSSQPDRAGHWMGHWPSYSEIPSKCRAAYLEWLAAGRTDPNAHIGYVYLFFYGLERRVLNHLRFAAEAITAELTLIMAEVERLLNLYGHDNSFLTDATHFLDICALLQAPTHWTNLAPPFPPTSAGMPLRVQLSLGQCAKTGQSVPADLALSWYLHSPAVKLFASLTRCLEELHGLFQLRYQQRYDQGLVVHPQHTQLTGQATYQPASVSFGGPVDVALPELPDVTSLEEPIQQLHQLVEECTQALDPYRRWLGRNPSERGSYAAVLLLPDQLAQAYESDTVKAFRDWVNGCLAATDSAVVEASNLLSAWSDHAPEKLAKAEAVTLSQYLEKIGIGIEPDVRLGGKPFTAKHTVVLFRLSEHRFDTVSPEYPTAALLLQLAAMVINANGASNAIQQAHLQSYLASTPYVQAGERVRLQAHLQWLLHQKLSFRGLKSRLATLSDDRKGAIAQFLIHLAITDGDLSSKESAVLTKIYPLLSLDANQVYSHIHQLMTDTMTSAAASESVIACATASTKSNLAVSSARETAEATNPQESQNHQDFSLNLDLIQRRQDETQAVSAMLADVFIEEDVSLTMATANLAPSEPSRLGLDGAHSTLLQTLAQRVQWDRQALEQLATQLGLMLDGALENLNEVAFDQCDDALTEGDDPVEVNLDVLEELLAS